MLVLLVYLFEYIENLINAIDKRRIPRNVIDKYKFYKMPSYRRFCPRNIIVARVTSIPHRQIHYPSYST